MHQAELIVRLADWLKSLAAVAAAFLGGSFGRGDADAYSDVDVYVVATTPEEIQLVLDTLASQFGVVSRIVFSQTLPNARTINAITVDWLRFDLTVVSPVELALLPRDGLEPLFDPGGLFETIPELANPHAPPPAGDLLDIVNEFIRVLGLSVVVKGRDDPVVAENGAELLRGMLIRVMVLENRPRFRRGALSLKQDLSDEQIAALHALPPLAAEWSTILARTAAITREFLPRARRLAQESNVAWPEEFERVTLAHVEDRLGLTLR